MPGDRRHKAEVSKRSFAVQEGDHMTLLNVYAAFLQNGYFSAAYNIIYFLFYTILNLIFV